LAHSSIRWNPKSDIQGFPPTTTFEKQFHELSLEGDIKELESMITTLTKSKSFLKDDNEFAEKVTLLLKQFRDLILCLSKLHTP